MNKLITSTVLAALVAIATSTAFAAPRTTQPTVQPSGSEQFQTWGNAEEMGIVVNH